MAGSSFIKITPNKPPAIIRRIICISKKADRTANRAAFKELEINETKEHFEEKLNAASLVIIVENNFFDNNEKLLENKKVISLFSHLNETIKYSNIAIPVASFYEKSGTYINTN